MCFAATAVFFVLFGVYQFSLIAVIGLSGYWGFKATKDMVDVRMEAGQFRSFEAAVQAVNERSRLQRENAKSLEQSVNGAQSLLAEGRQAVELIETQQDSFEKPVEKLQAKLQVLSDGYSSNKKTLTQLQRKVGVASRDLSAYKSNPPLAPIQVNATLYSLKKPQSFTSGWSKLLFKDRMAVYESGTCLDLSAGVDEVQLSLGFVEDNGHVAGKSGEYAVDGNYRQHPEGDYYMSDEEQPPRLLLSIEEGAVVDRVQILQRWGNKFDGY